MTWERKASQGRSARTCLKAFNKMLVKRRRLLKPFKSPKSHYKIANSGTLEGDLARGGPCNSVIDE